MKKGMGTTGHPSGSLSLAGGTPGPTREAAVPRLIDIPAVAEALNTSERHVRSLIERRELPYYKVGALVRIDSDELTDWLAERKRPAEAVGA